MNEAEGKQPEFDGRKVAGKLSTKPGVYRMLSESGDVLYVGKAGNLRKRVSSYFTRGALNTRTLSMLAQVRDIEVSITRTEGEALLLENQLIKRHQPRYNVLLRDDKSYPHILLTKGEPFPRLAFHRGPQRIKGKYFGPFPSAYSVRDSLKQMQKLFRVRQCEDTFFNNRSRPCLQYQIKRCSGPCVDLIDEQAYGEDVRHAALFLAGESNRVISELIERMEQHSAELEFEQAAAVRDQIAVLKRVQEKQYVSGVTGDLDVVAAHADGATACVQVFFIRGGRNLGNRPYYPRLPRETQTKEVLQAFLAQYYNTKTVPPEILISESVDDKTLLEEVFTNKSGRRVRIIAQPRGERARWLDMARTNAEQALKSHMASHSGMRRRLKALAELLSLEELPGRMECFDISHTQGEATVASCVVFDHNGPVKSDYRRFNIKGITPGDDYAAMRQALERRYRRLKAGEGTLPDILLIDGGKGQLSQATSVMEELQVDGILLVGVAKGTQRRAGHEQILVAGRKSALFPGPDHPASHLIQAIRDEAHRFAITGHRQRRAKQRKSSLESIPGVGAKRRADLLKHFGGLQGIKRAGVEELASINGISRELAQRIYDSLHG